MSIFEEKKFLKILQLQKEYTDWNKISNLLRELNIDKSAKQCYTQWYGSKKKKEYYNCQFHTRIKNLKKKEKKLLKLFFEYAPQWEKIINFFGDR